MSDIEEKKEQGYIQSKVVIELAGKPKEHIEKTIGCMLIRLKMIRNLQS